MRVLVRASASLAVISSLSLALVGCGGSADPQTLATCEALCDVQAKGTGCTQAAGDNCKSLCGTLVSSFSADCQATARAAYECQKTLSWSCPNGSELAISTDQACASQAQALQSCM